MRTVGEGLVWAGGFVELQVDLVSAPGPRKPRNDPATRHARSPNTHSTLNTLHNPSESREFRIRKWRGPTTAGMAARVGGCRACGPSLDADQRGWKVERACAFGAACDNPGAA